MPIGVDNAPEQSVVALDSKTAARIQAVPILERNTTNIVSKMQGERDRIYDELVAACATEGVDGMVLKSYPYAGQVWVSCECWLPDERDNRLRTRASAVVTIRGREYHRFEYELDIVINLGNKSETFPSVIAFSPQTARMVVQYLLRRIYKCDFDRRRVSFYDLRYPRNRITVPRDPLEISIFALFGLGGVVYLGAGLSGSGALALIGAILLLVGVAVAPVLASRKKKLYVVSSGKPAEEPRRLLRMDSWQTLVTGLGKSMAKVKSDVRAVLRPTEHDGARLSDEKIWYRGIDGKEEREQLVICFRRAVAFIHIYAYGDDLFVGWDAHVNGGTWLETKVGIRRDPKTKAACQLNSIQAGWQSPSEYDITDAETLIERVHAAVTQVVKRIMAENKIDQDIDFKIQQRGERQGIAGHADTAAAPQRSRFLRKS
jgi:hypothetical protein